jgi:hypothetical protein
VKGECGSEIQEYEVDATADSIFKSSIHGRSSVVSVAVDLQALRQSFLFYLRWLASGPGDAPENLPLILSETF